MSITPLDLPLERVFRWERERAGAVFLTQPFDGGKVRNWTWAEAVREARRVAAWLKTQPWEPDSRIAILSKNCAWWIISDLAIWMAGHVSVPVYPSLRAESVRQILEHSGARACFVGAVDDPRAAEAVCASGTTAIAFPNAPASAGVSWDKVVEANPPLPGSPVRAADDLATIIYTSGTTGTPKGVMHRFGSFAHNAQALAGRLPFDGEQRVLSYLPLAHIVERVAVEALSCTLGWHVYFTEGLETFLQDLRRARPTIFLSVPRLLVKFQQGVFAKIPKRKLDALLRIPGINALLKRRVLHQLGLDTAGFAACGAAPLPVDILLWYRSLGLPLIEGYGMTETMITHIPRPDDLRPGFVGRPLEGVETGLGPENELLVRSPMNMLGYYREPELTAAAFTPDGFFKTGDVVEIDPDGQLKIVGRVKEQFKTSKGKYVAPAPIESRLMNHPAVEACCLMGAGQPSAFAVVTLSDAARAECKHPAARQAMEQSLAALLESINQDLESFERLSMIVIVDGPWTIANGLLTPTMKIRRGPLESQYARRIQEWRAQDRPVVWEG
jgi:long-chain acyl-CoA synthetase